VRDSVVLSFGPAAAETDPSPSADPAIPLSARLRADTAAEHERIESLLGLPGSLRSRGDYAAWLAGSRGLLAPLHRRLAALDGWAALGLDLAARSPLARLDDDLRRLGLDPGTVPEADGALLPRLPGLPQGLGALYVVEGATLGARVILRELRDRLGAELGGATAFLEGHGEATGERWRELRAALDAFGRRRPAAAPAVVAGARATFGAYGRWLGPRLRGAR
jgi:heme oxygenase